MLLTDGFASLKVGDGPGYLENAVERAGRETQPVGDQFQHPVAGGIQFTIFPEMAGDHLGVAVDLGPGEPVILDVAGALHPTADSLGTLGLGPVGQVTIADCRNLGVNVDPVQEGSGDAGTVPLKHDGSTGADMEWIIPIAAGAGVC